jgi:hypothetical protein
VPWGIVARLGVSMAAAMQSGISDRRLLLRHLGSLRPRIGTLPVPCLP